MEPENISVDDAQKLLEESFASFQKDAPPLQIAPQEPEPAATPEPAEVVDTATEPVEKAPTKEEPEATTPTEEPPAKPEKSADKYAWVEKVPEDVRAHVLEEINQRAAAYQQWASNNGRISSMQKKILELTRELTSRTPAETPAPARPAPTTPEGWATLNKDDPELASAVEARIKAEVEAAVGPLKDALQEVRKSGDALYEYNHQQYVEEQRAALSAQVSNYEEVVTSDSFKHWVMNIAPEAIRNTALHSVEAKDAIGVLRYYADDMIRLGYAQPSTQQPPTQASAASSLAPTPSSSTVDKIVEERGRKAGAPTVVKSPPALSARGPIDPKGPVRKEDADAIFLEAWKSLHKT